VRCGTPHERKQLALRLGTPGKFLLLEAFQAVAEDGYRLLFFGDPNAKGSVEEANAWLSENEGNRWKKDKTVLVGKAINFMRDNLKTRLLYRKGGETVPCTMSSEWCRNCGQRFRLNVEGQTKTRVLSSVTLPSVRYG